MDIDRLFKTKDDKNLHYDMFNHALIAGDIVLVAVDKSSIALDIVLKNTPTAIRLMINGLCYSKGIIKVSENLMKEIDESEIHRIKKSYANYLKLVDDSKNKSKFFVLTIFKMNDSDRRGFASFLFNGSSTKEIDANAKKFFSNISGASLKFISFENNELSIEKEYSKGCLLRNSYSMLDHFHSYSKEGLKDEILFKNYGNFGINGGSIFYAMTSSDYDAFDQNTKTTFDNLESMSISSSANLNVKNFFQCNKNSKKLPFNCSDLILLSRNNNFMMSNGNHYIIDSLDLYRRSFFISTTFKEIIDYLTKKKFNIPIREISYLMSDFNYNSYDRLSSYDQEKLDYMKKIYKYIISEMFEIDIDSL